MQNVNYIILFIVIQRSFRSLPVTAAKRNKIGKLNIGNRNGGMSHSRCHIRRYSTTVKLFATLSRENFTERPRSRESFEIDPGQVQRYEKINARALENRRQCTVRKLNENLRLAFRSWVQRNRLLNIFPSLVRPRKSWLKLCLWIYARKYDEVDWEFAVESFQILFESLRVIVKRRILGNFNRDWNICCRWNTFLILADWSSVFLVRFFNFSARFRYLLAY